MHLTYDLTSQPGGENAKHMTSL